VNLKTNGRDDSLGHCKKQVFAVVVYCKVLQCMSEVCQYSALQCAAMYVKYATTQLGVSPCPEIGRSVLKCIAVCCSALQCLSAICQYRFMRIAVCAVWYRVLQYTYEREMTHRGGEKGRVLLQLLWCSGP